jgi:hypothetical protein
MDCGKLAKPSFNRLVQKLHVREIKRCIGKFDLAITSCQRGTGFGNGFALRCAK